MYRQFNNPIESIGRAIVINQQRLLLQEQNSTVHSHQATITDIIYAIKKRNKNTGMKLLYH